MHHNQALCEQLAALQQEVAANAQPYQVMLAMLPWRHPPGPAAVGHALTLDIAALHRCLADITHDTAQLRDPSKRKAAFGQVVQGDPEDEADPFEIMLMMAAMAEVDTGPERRKRC